MFSFVLYLPEKYCNFSLNEAVNQRKMLRRPTSLKPHQVKSQFSPGFDGLLCLVQIWLGLDLDLSSSNNLKEEVWKFGHQGRISGEKFNENVSFLVF